MFERTFSFWRSRKKEYSHAGAAACLTEKEPDERRLWVRYPAEVATDVQLVDRESPERMAAQVRDISRGGASLLLDRDVPPGQLLNIELPSADTSESQTVLACVVRSNAGRAGEWIVGCVFSRELSEADLAGCDSRRGQPRSDDKRTWMRIDCQLTARIQQVGAKEEGWHQVQVLNISASGLGIVSDRFLDAGSLLNVELLGRDGKAARTILACVVHVSSRGATEWALGCNFIRELNDEDFQALI